MRSQEPSIGSYSEPFECSPHPYTVFLTSIVILSFDLRVLLCFLHGLFSQVIARKFCACLISLFITSCLSHSVENTRPVKCVSTVRCQVSLIRSLSCFAIPSPGQRLTSQTVHLLGDDDLNEEPLSGLYCYLREGVPRVKRLDRPQCRAYFHLALNLA